MLQTNLPKRCRKKCLKSCKQIFPKCCKHICLKGGKQSCLKRCKQICQKVAKEISSRLQTYLSRRLQTNFSKMLQQICLEWWKKNCLKSCNQICQKVAKNVFKVANYFVFKVASNGATKQKRTRLYWTARMRTEPPLNQSLITWLPRGPNVNFIARSTFFFLSQTHFWWFCVLCRNTPKSERNNDNNLDRNDNNDNNCRTQRRAWIIRPIISSSAKTVRIQVAR